METKPFSLQSPEQIAKDYGGNKQKIAQAMQMGIVDPTAGTLAGMFIDRMRSAQMMEQAPQGTIAQQVMGGLPPAPQMAPPPSGGLGATPQAGPPMAPQMPPQQETIDVPMPSDEMPEMAAGGIAGLSVPDNMFDEPDGGGYATGGLVAFAGGGWGRYFEDLATKYIPGIGITSRQRSAAKNAEVGGVPDSFHQTDDARDFVPPPGMDMATLHSKLKAKFGSQYDVLNEGDHVHIEPGPGLAKQGLVALTNPAQAANPEAPMDLPGGSLSDQMMPAFERASAFYDQFVPKNKTEAREKVKARIEERMSEENQKKEENYDKWSTLAEIGFNIAGSNAPSLLQAVGAAAAAALPGARQAKKDREARYDTALERYAELEGIENAEARDRVKFMLDFGKTELELKDKDLTRGTNWANQKMQDATQRFGIATQAASSKYATDKQLEAAGLRSAATENALLKQATQAAWKSAEEELQQDTAYRTSKDPAAKAKRLQELAQQKLAVYLSMVNSGGGAGGIPGLPGPDFVIDE
jgi:hypothetical protein